MPHAGDARATSPTIPRHMASCGLEPACRPSSAKLPRPWSHKDLPVARWAVSGVGMRQTMQGAGGRASVGERRGGMHHAAHRWPCRSQIGGTPKPRKSTICSSSAVSFISSERARCEKARASPDDSRIAKPASNSCDESAPEQKSVMCNRLKMTRGAHGWADWSGWCRMYDQILDGSVRLSKEQCVCAGCASALLYTASDHLPSPRPARATWSNPRRGTVSMVPRTNSESPARWLPAPSRTPALSGVRSAGI